MTDTKSPETGEIERVAKAIYDRMPYDEAGQKPKWVPNGNSLKQDEARSYARAALAASEAQDLEAVRRERDWAHFKIACAEAVIKTMAMRLDDANDQLTALRGVLEAVKSIALKTRAPASALKRIVRLCTEAMETTGGGHV